jgi:hypothetical protein
VSKRLAKGTARWWTRRLDPLWSQAAKTRTPYCEKCGRSDIKLDAHHIEGRGEKRLRFDLRNSCVLCFPHHRWAEESPLGFTDWIRATRPADVAYIEAELRRGPLYHSDTPYEAIEAELRAVLDERMAA